MSKRCKYTRLIHPKSLTELTRRSTTVYGRIHEFPSKYVLRNLYGFHIEKHVKRAFTYSSYMNSKKMADINVNSMTILLLYKSVNKNLKTVLFTHNGNLQWSGEIKYCNFTNFAIILAWKAILFNSKKKKKKKVQSNFLKMSQNAKLSIFSFK